MAKFCVWRNHANFTDNEDVPRFAFANSHTEAEQAAENWRSRDQQEIANYTSSDDHHISVIQDRSYCVESCDGENCRCKAYIQQNFNGDNSFVESSTNSWSELDTPAEPAPKKGFFGLF